MNPIVTPIFNTPVSQPLTQTNPYLPVPFSTEAFFRSFDANPKHGIPTVPLIFNANPGDSSCEVAPAFLHDINGMYKNTGALVWQTVDQASTYATMSGSSLPIDMDATTSDQTNKTSFQLITSRSNAVTVPGIETGQEIRMLLQPTSYKLTTGYDSGGHTVLQTNTVASSENGTLALTTDGYFLGVDGFDAAATLFGFEGETLVSKALDFATKLYASLPEDYKAGLDGLTISIDGTSMPLNESDGRLSLPEGVLFTSASSVVIKSNTKKNPGPYADPILKIIFAINPNNNSEIFNMWLNPTENTSDVWALPENIITSYWMPIQNAAQNAAQTAWTQQIKPDYVTPLSVSDLKQGDRIQLTLSAGQTTPTTIYAVVTSNDGTNLNIDFENSIGSYMAASIPVNDGLVDLSINPGTQFEETWTVTIVTQSE